MRGGVEGKHVSDLRTSMSIFWGLFRSGYRQDHLPAGSRQGDPSGNRSELVPTAPSQSPHAAYLVQPKAYYIMRSPNLPKTIVPNQSERVATQQHGRRWFQLDGWRGISICLVLAAHLLPLGPAKLQLNYTAGAMGMSLFFCLSGFLITSFILERPQPVPFLIRRFCRILPLAWLFMLLYLLVTRSGRDEVVANLAFLINYEHQYLRDYNGHMWSLCLEMHFYLFVTALVAIFGRRGLFLLPVVCLAVTANRIMQGVPISIVTHLRVDEILVGANWRCCIVDPKLIA